VSSTVFLNLTRECTRVFLNLRRKHDYRKLPLCKHSLFISLLLSCFVEKKYFLGNVGTYKIGELPLSA
jgi:hypothetical protein